MALDAGSFANVEDYIKALQAENEQLRAKSSRVGRLSIKVSEKGGVSVYKAGARRQGFKVALFAHQRMAKLQRECAAMMLEHLDAAIYSTCKALRGVA